MRILAPHYSQDWNMSRVVGQLHCNDAQILPRQLLCNGINAVLLQYRL